MDSKEVKFVAGSLYDSIQDLSEFRKEKIDKDVSHKMLRNFKILDAELTSLNEHQTELVEKYAQRDENGKMIQEQTEEGGVSVALTDPTAFRGELAELMTSEIVCTIYPITFEDLPEKCSISMMDSLEKIGVLDLAN